MLDIWYEGRRVGELDSRDRDLVLRYAPEWVADADSFPLSPRLPLAQAEHVGEEPLVFVSNLLPEGPLLSALIKLRRLPKNDVLALMREFGAEVAGAFSILPKGEIPSAKGRYVPYPEKTLCADLQAVRDNVPLVSRHEKVRLSLAGAQNKIAVYVSAVARPPRDAVMITGGVLMLPADGAASSHILKPNIQPARDYPQSVDNEALCLALASACGLPAARGEIVTACGERVLLIGRYDRAPAEDGRLHRLHQLDFCQLAGSLPDLKYEEQGGPSLGDVFTLIRQHSAVPSRDVLTAVDWVIFNYLVGNADAHAKNLAMMPTARDKFRLASWYDILCTDFYPGLTTKMAMRIGGENRPDWVRAGNWQRFAADTGINPSLLRKRFPDLGKPMLEALPRVASALRIDPDGRLATHLRKTIAKRLRWSVRTQESL
ncbi:MAG TPA: type II toxin-antitoxin system HipA family toxin [Burkholderiales bacterium]|nr:type II toxin-antitoxin system HipA family toxin [Burkholderiales bacterium]